ncbi:MAG: LemA family protein [bacterium]|nr:LemA family protein [bacterium]MDZ4299323.1 LemA family protein [Candidatus Sungbacteria bacterium]
MNQLYIIGGVVVLAIFFFIGIYNGLIRRRNQAEEAWSDIEVQLKRRYDLIPNIIETVKGYAGHERETLDSVTMARTQAMGAQTADEHAKAENVLAGTLKTLFAVSENYPQLKANENFLELQRELSDTENKIQSARRFFNGVVRDYNIAIQSFPSSVVAGMFGFTRKELFDLSDTDVAQQPVKVQF